MISSASSGTPRPPHSFVFTPEVQAPKTSGWPVGFGALQANNLRWLGTYDAAADKIIVVTAIGVSEGITAGQAFPAPTDQLSGGYFLCQNRR